MKTLQEKIAVMLAAAAGKQIERRPKGIADWLRCDEPSWDWVLVDYRIKPEPRHVYAEACIEDGKFTENVFFPAPDAAMPPTRLGCVWVEFVEVLK